MVKFKRVGITAAAVLLGAAIAASAQAPPCKLFYPVGEVPPAGCVKTFDRWGDGQVVVPDPNVTPGDAVVRTFYPPTAPVGVPSVPGMR